ncbi:MAG: hypothetical protein NT075_07540 [Chloroflexi bacterium]|nr:hypothetical protein [Chloroflexota bacterium]
MTDGIRWGVYDRHGNQIYLTEERWQHITEPTNHPELLDYERELRQTVEQGRRKQDEVNPQKYLYTKAFDHLYEDNTHIVVIILFRFRENEQGRPVANNYIVTAYQKEIG